MTFRYGIDAPFWVGALIVAGFVFSLISITGLPQSIGGLIFGLFLLCMGLWMFFYSTVIKIKHRYVILRLAEVQAGEEVLDVGTERGLLAIATAKLGCNVTAIDHWSQWDISSNGREAFFKNVEIEKAPPMELIDGDARELPFADERFDAVVSNFVIHNIKGAKGREQAVREMWRVFRPNGRLVTNMQRVSEYTKILTPLANRIETRKVFYTFPFSEIVVTYIKNSTAKKDQIDFPVCSP
ncbi:class I SAM-dependent methyltransferase [Saccharococcus caldoxylosilyticus]|uniref:class I SAM-dependent methyltransferase n=1 Tax=Saccharococcus caldoxylosilyticus TaxID=81408 RepID=UPI001FCA7CE7|nr:class I SAM-dependent methyltransferase [Parageobacillus caldoxylosilyticus]BDG35560.1 type 11 methyltransferase [Parageobacillus caldoxylosilyticus]BDG39339.1 type 11 methyltransferase [Parageobacillus caldoxylosilyticus]BDG43122.1 type 11 methyltransferase [Parageobacillus caldoxylosilyticus]